jgi:hypothetical protein
MDVAAGIWIRKSQHYYTFLNTYLILLQVHSFESGYSSFSLTQPQDLQRMNNTIQREKQEEEELRLGEFKPMIRTRK